MKKYLIILGVVIGIGVILIWWYREKQSESRPLVLYGNIDQRQVDLGFRVFGKLKSMNFEEGDIVNQGDLLAELDDKPYIQNLKENEGRVKALIENLAYASIQLEHRSRLVENRSVSEEDYQQAFFSEKSYEANLQEAGAQLEYAKIQLQDTALLSPSHGVIYTRIREPGTVLNVGEPVYSMLLFLPIWARVYISEPDLGRIFPGMKAEIYTDTPENPIYQGHIGFISPIAEFTPKNVETPDLRTSLVYQLRVYIDNPDKGLRQGMPVTVKFKKHDSNSR